MATRDLCPRNNRRDTILSSLNRVHDRRIYNITPSVCRDRRRQRYDTQYNNNNNILAAVQNTRGREDRRCVPPVAAVTRVSALPSLTAARPAPARIQTHTRQMSSAAVSAAHDDDGVPFYMHLEKNIYVRSYVGHGVCTREGVCIPVPMSITDGPTTCGFSSFNFSCAAAAAQRFARYRRRTFITDDPL